MRKNAKVPLGWAKRPPPHRRPNGPESGTADPDIDDIPDGLARMTLPGAAPHLFTELGHPVQDGVDLRYDILAVDDDRCAGRSAQRGMQDGAVFGDVDLASRKHRRDPLLQAR